MKNIISIVFLSLQITAHGQGPIDGFLKGKYVLDAAFSASYQFADTYQGGSGPLAINRGLVMTSLFGQFGLTDRFDLVATLPVINGKPQDGGIYGKYRLTELNLKNQKLSILPALGLTAPLSNYGTQQASAIGQRATQFHGHLVLQTSLPAGFYWQAQAAYHLSLDPVPSSYTFSSKLMYTRGKWYADFWYEYQKGLGTATYSGQQIDFRTLTVDYQRFGGVIFKELKKDYGIFLSGSYIFEGLGTFIATTVSVGVTKKFRFKQNQ